MDWFRSFNFQAKCDCAHGVQEDQNRQAVWHKREHRGEIVVLYRVPRNETQCKKQMQNQTVQTGELQIKIHIPQRKLSRPEQQGNESRTENARHAHGRFLQG